MALCYILQPDGACPEHQNANMAEIHSSIQIVLTDLFVCLLLCWSDFLLCVF